MRKIVWSPCCCMGHMEVHICMESDPMHMLPAAAPPGDMGVPRHKVKPYTFFAWFSGPTNLPTIYIFKVFDSHSNFNSNPPIKPPCKSMHGGNDGGHDHPPKPFPPKMAPKQHTSIKDCWIIIPCWERLCDPRLVAAELGVRLRAVKRWLTHL